MDLLKLSKYISVRIFWPILAVVLDFFVSPSGFLRKLTLITLLMVVLDLLPSGLVSLFLIWSICHWGIDTVSSLRGDASSQ